jgi:8-oxo-dGTP pyrophosphatase MutT (NUDIX family)
MSEQPLPPKRWKKLGARMIAQTRIFDVLSVDFQHPARPKPQDFFVISAPDWVNVVALTPERHLVLVRQFRYGMDDFSVEIPGGVMDAGEDAIAAGVRELREETGYVGTSARLLGSVRPNPAMQNNRCHLVLVENARPEAVLDWDPDEELEIMTRPVDEVYQLAYAGGITHAMVLDALLLFMPVWQKLKGDSAV